LAMLDSIVVSVAAPVKPINCMNERRLLLLMRELLSIENVCGSEPSIASNPLLANIGRNFEWSRC
jgi:hypothetical protein